MVPKEIITDYIQHRITHGKCQKIKSMIAHEMTARSEFSWCQTFGNNLTNLGISL